MKPEIEIYKSEKDDVWVVQVDTTDMPEDIDGPYVRIYLNDYCLHENPPYFKKG